MSTYLPHAELTDKLVRPEGGATIKIQPAQLSVTETMGFEAPLKHHDENVPPCFPQKHPHLEDVATVPLPSVEVEVSVLCSFGGTPAPLPGTLCLILPRCVAAGPPRRRCTDVRTEEKRRLLLPLQN